MALSHFEWVNILIKENYRHYKLGKNIKITQKTKEEILMLFINFSSFNILGELEE